MTEIPDDKKPLINLWGISGIGLLIPHPSGVIYSSKAGGVRLDNPRIEGVFIPLNDSGEDAACEELHHHFGPRGKWRSGCGNGIDDETADFLDDLLLRFRWTNSLGIRVDRDYLKDCLEAWIHVVIHTPDTRYPLLAGFEYIDAILTWKNSD